MALAKGDFAQASELLKQLQKDIAQGKLSEQQQKALAGQLQELGKQLQELAQKNAELEKELEKLGLDKSLATLSTSGGPGTIIGMLGGPEIHGLAIRPGSNELYGSASGASTTTLYKISSADAEALPVATIPLGNLRAIAFASEDVLYAGTPTGRLYRLLAPSWDTVYVGTAPGIVYSSLAFNPTSGSLWASIRPIISFTKAKRACVGSLGFMALSL